MMMVETIEASALYTICLREQHIIMESNITAVPTQEQSQ